MTSPSAPYPYPQSAPVVSGTTITVDRYLRSPTLLPKLLQDFTTQKFVADFLFRKSNADGGSVIYDVAASQDLFVDVDPNLQPQILQPGMEFPNVMVGDLTSQVATVDGYGGQFPVSYVQVRRNTRDVVGRGLIRLGNTLIRQSNNRAIAAINNNAGVVKAAAAGFWDGATPTFIADITNAIARVDNTDLEYASDTAIINPLDLAIVKQIPAVIAQLPRENVGINPILNKSVNGLLGLDWITSRLQPRGSVIVCQRGVIGAIAEEIPQYSRQVDQPERERWIVQAARWDIPIITDPLSATVVYSAVTGT